jgi:NADH dehydrogenase
VHVYFLISFRNRLIVALRWLWAYLTYQRGVRLITGDEIPYVRGSKDDKNGDKKGQSCSIHH